jgi:hypothetical protein
MNKAFSFLFLIAAFSPISADEQMAIGIVDFYGLRSLTEDQVRAALPITEGMVVSSDYSFPDENAMSEVAEALGVLHIELSAICCDEPFELIVYIGIEEEQRSPLKYRDEPVGNKKLPAEILETARQLESAMIAAIQKGDSGEDRSQGHSLMVNPDARVLQQKYIEYAEEYRNTLIEVLHNSAQQRALAATVLAYSSDKKSIVRHLEAAVLDPDVNVRNDASRALALIAGYANENLEQDIKIDAAIFVDMLDSVAFYDRNKSAAVLLNLTDSRDPQVLEQIRANALPSLIEMCQWESEGHAWTPCKILERTVGMPDQEELHPKDESIGAALELLRLQAAK